MKKTFIFSLVTLLLASFTLLVGCGNSTEQSSTTTATTQGATTFSDNKVLRVGMECSYAPFNWTQETDTLPTERKRFPFKEQTIMPMDMMLWWLRC